MTRHDRTQRMSVLLFNTGVPNAQFHANQTSFIFWFASLVKYETNENKSFFWHPIPSKFILGMEEIK